MTDIEKWIMGIIAVVLTGGAANWMRVMHDDLKNLVQKIEELREDLSKTRLDTSVMSERISQLRERVGQIDAAQTAIHRRLDRASFPSARDHNQQENI